MIVVICTHCALTVRVLGEPAEVDHLVGEGSEFWPDRYPCPRCEHLAVASLERDLTDRDLTRLSIRDLTAQEAFAAFNGLGLPGEHLCTKDVVEALLREKPVRRLVGSDIEGGRCYLHHLELWDGTKIYFGAGAEGALIYRIAPPHSYTEQASHEHRAG